MTAFKLGPNQTAFVEALESGEYEQGYGLLYDIGCRCVLGVLCEVAGIKVDVKLGEYCGNSHTAPEEAVEFVALFDRFGAHKSDAYAGLSYLNDSMCKTLPDIAAIIRAEPENYFREPR